MKLNVSISALNLDVHPAVCGGLYPFCIIRLCQPDSLIFTDTEHTEKHIKG